MFLKYFRSNGLSLFFVNPILLLLVWIPSFTGKAAAGASLKATGIIDSYFMEFVITYPLLSDILTVAIIVVNGLLLVELNTQHFFIPVRGLMPGLIYALLCSAIPSLSQLTPALVASALIILVLFRVFSTFRQDGLSYNYFDAGILLSLAGILYLPSLLFYPVLLIALAILRPYQWREWVFTLAGLAVPAIFLFSYYFLTDRSIGAQLKSFADYFRAGEREQFSNVFLIFLVALGIIVLTGSAYMIRIISLMKIHSRKFFMIFLWLFVFSILIYIFIPPVSNEIIYFTAVPVSFLAGNYFMQCRLKRINNILFLLFVASVYILRYLQF